MYRYDPFGLFNEFRGMRRLLNDMDRVLSPDAVSARVASAYPKINVWSNASGAILTAEIPGVDPKDIEVSTQNSKVIIKSETRGREKSASDAYHRSERSTGKFQRELELPFRINSSKVEAECKNGVLKLVLPRAAEDQPKQITVKAS